MSRWLTVCLTPLAAASLVGALSLTDGKTRLSAAEIGNSGVVTKPIKANTTKARRDLEAAAKRGKLDAQIKLARMHALGVGVEHNDAKAFELYLKIITNHVNVRPQDAQARDLAQAFVALGNYYRTGIPGSNIKADPHQAVSVLRYAASYFGNVEAQSNLAQMYLDGEGIERNARLALNWLVNAANKRHAKSQAILGDLLWRGADGVPRQPKKGLALLALAQQNANGKKEARWIEDLYAGAVAGSKLSERLGGEKLAASWQDRMGRPESSTKTADAKPVKPAVEAKKKAPAEKVDQTEKTTAAADLTQTGIEAVPAPRQ